jgi:hypothetical protein
VAGSSGAQGSSGATGPQGPGGKEGPKGEPGASGISGYQIVEGTIAKGGGSGFNVAIAWAKCPSGKSLLGGGFHILTGADAKIFVADNGPNGSDEWKARLTSGSLKGYTARAYAICATVTS